MVELEQLVKNFQSKDEKAFQKLYGMFHHSINGVIYNIVKDADIADELTQDVFMKAWQSSESYSAKKGRFFTWMLNIARNTAIDKLRSKAFKNSKQNLNADFFVNSIESNENLNDAMNAIGIKKYVEKLTQKCIEVIDLLYFKGFTHKEASESLSMPIGSIKTKNRNCIQELRNMVLN